MFDETNKGMRNVGATPEEAGNLHIAIVQARFNADITDSMCAQCTKTLRTLGVVEDHLKVSQVPGALEIPVVLQALAERDKYDALIAIGCVVRGQTYHFELVASESARGVARIAMDYEIPVINAILTVENLGQAHARMHEKSVDAGYAAIEMAQLINRLA